MATKENKMTQDEALAEKIALKSAELERDGKSHFERHVGIAEMLRTEVIDPAVIAGSVKMLKAHRNALYDSMPTGVDLDAMDMLNIVSTHLQNVDASIAGLENALKPVEVLEKEKAAKPLERMAQEAEVVEDENSKS